MDSGTHGTGKWNDTFDMLMYARSALNSFDHSAHMLHVEDTGQDLARLNLGPKSLRGEVKPPGC